MPAFRFNAGRRFCRDRFTGGLGRQGGWKPTRGSSWLPAPLSPQALRIGPMYNVTAQTEQFRCLWRRGVER
jgi:hypothetical protein